MRPTFVPRFFFPPGECSIAGDTRKSSVTAEAFPVSKVPLYGKNNNNRGTAYERESRIVFPRQRQPFYQMNSQPASR